MKTDLAGLRQEYWLHGLHEDDVLPNPSDQFKVWLDASLRGGIAEPNAMHLATVDPSGRPSGRIVLLKELDGEGFVFYTNYLSRKGADLATNPYACLTFFWVELERQVRIEGQVEKISEADSDGYFAVRPRGSQIGAWVSSQSEPIGSREDLEAKQAAYEKKFEGHEVPRPAHWGGYRVVPDRVEFWQGRPSRLHDRLLYERESGSVAWKITRLSP